MQIQEYPTQAEETEATGGGALATQQKKWQAGSVVSVEEKIKATQPMTSRQVTGLEYAATQAH